MSVGTGGIVVAIRTMPTVVKKGGGKQHFHVDIAVIICCYIVLLIKLLYLLINTDII
jgi:hypothetical protein